VQALVVCVYSLWLFGYMYLHYNETNRLQLSNGVQDSDKERVHVAQKAADQFACLFTALLLSWIFLYLYLWYFPAPSPTHAECENALNNLISCFILACYYTLGYYTVAEQTPGSKSEAEIKRGRNIALLGAFVILVVSFCAQWTFDSCSFPTGAKFMTWSSGAVGGVLTALLVERLGSRSIRAPFGLIFVLYVYSTIQFSWAFFMSEVLMERSEEMWFKFVMPIAALIGKSVLFLLVLWMIESGKLDFYMWRSRNVLSQISVDEERYRGYFA